MRHTCGHKPNMNCIAVAPQSNSVILRSYSLTVVCHREFSGEDRWGTLAYMVLQDHPNHRASGNSPSPSLVPASSCFFVPRFVSCFWVRRFVITGQANFILPLQRSLKMNARSCENLLISLNVDFSSRTQKWHGKCLMIIVVMKRHML